MLGDRVDGLNRHPSKGFGAPSMAGVRVLRLDSMGGGWLWRGHSLVEDGG
jgi:hypothetical protein